MIEKIKTIAAYFKRASSQEEYDQISKDILSYIRENKPYYYIHLSEDIDYTGINVNTTFSTPAGLYLYPLTSSIYNQFINHNLPFAGNRKYVHIFRPTTANILFVDEYSEITGPV